jgi:hypothetical protein
METKEQEFNNQNPYVNDNNNDIDNFDNDIDMEEILKSQEYYDYLNNRKTSSKSLINLYTKLGGTDEKYLKPDKNNSAIVRSGIQKLLKDKYKIETKLKTKNTPKFKVKT